MHMNLRKTIRLPQRFSPDHLYGPRSRKLRGDDTERPPLVEYNPNLPPAAFPTLDTPRTSRQDHNTQQEGSDEDRHNGPIRRNIRRSLDDLCRLTNPESERDTSPNAHVEDIPPDQLDNHMASNGDLNPVWVSNMASMAAADQDAAGGMDMEDTDLESMVTGKTQTPPTALLDPIWSDLSYRMKAEIFQNLLERFSYPAVCRMLGLTTAERDAIEDTLSDRRSQEESENKHLDAMREKQLNDLARIDNSFRNQSRSYQLAFRKVSRQTFRGLREYIEPEVDFFACGRAELKIAQTFLRKRGIEAKFAGTWGNDIAFIRTLETETPFGMFGLDGAPGPNIVPFESNEAQPSTSPTTPNSQPETPHAFKDAYSNWLGDSPTSDSPRPIRHNRDSVTARRWLEQYNETVDKEMHHGAESRRQLPENSVRQDRQSLLPGSSSARMSNPRDGHPGELALNSRLQHQQQRPQQNNQINSPQRPDPGLQVPAAPIPATNDQDTHSSRLFHTPRLDGDLEMHEYHDPDETEDEFMHWDEMTIFPN
ncbi:uncharacterized protein DSM5745_06712 [Aspergillus mulundensis]|uniref:Uncharacterized protein n=1 Tax=Aspergillus mulundensis TaxID=1810919 RepID=A0A3D8RRX8_9EURO|nr:hypothetical protein DSM5745_06712 [Aspergillus mulundensis]RDW76720.1 hypothetical protein DSM5745_06712 [Aspergillus mulundensis]